MAKRQARGFVHADMGKVKELSGSTQPQTGKKDMQTKGEISFIRRLRRLPQIKEIKALDAG